MLTLKEADKLIDGLMNVQNQQSVRIAQLEQQIKALQNMLELLTRAQMPTYLSGHPYVTVSQA